MDRHFQTPLDLPQEEGSFNNFLNANPKIKAKMLALTSSWGMKEWAGVGAETYQAVDYTQSRLPAAGDEEAREAAMRKWARHDYHRVERCAQTPAVFTGREAPLLVTMGLRLACVQGRRGGWPLRGVSPLPLSLHPSPCRKSELKLLGGCSSPEVFGSQIR